jgi:hypothetical protein
MDAAFKEQTTATYKSFLSEENLDEARKALPGLWTASLTENGKIWDGHAMYVTIGRVP